MKIIRHIILIFPLVLLYGGYCFSSEMDFNSHVEALSILKKDERTYAVSEISVVKDADHGHMHRLTVKGRGQYDVFKDAVWTGKAEILQEDNKWIVQQSSTEVYVKGKLVFRASKKYDYAQSKVFAELMDKDRAEVIKKEFPIKGYMLDDVTMVHLLSMYIYAQGKKDVYSNFYLITNEMKMYDVTVKYRLDEFLDLWGKRVAAEKVQLMADLGPLTELAAKMVPATYIWFDKEYPYQWLQYEGMESGYKSAHIKVIRK